MKLFEYQGKELFRQVGIPVPDSLLVRVPASASLDNGIDNVIAQVQRAGAELFNQAGETALVLKAQLDMGGRGKAGLITVVPASKGSDSGTDSEAQVRGDARLVDGSGADGEDRAVANGEAGFSGNGALSEGLAEATRSILGKGYSISALLLERAVSIQSELYLSISLEPTLASYIILASTEGGVDIEELASQKAQAICRVLVDPFRGLQAYQIRELAFGLNLKGQVQKAFTSVLKKAYKLFIEKDAELIEINPLFISKAGELVAGDSKVIIDDNSTSRHAEFSLSREQFESDAAFEAAQEGIPYLQFNGNISLMCAGAGLTTTVFDLVIDAGGSVANYLEFGGPNYHRAERAMELCLQNRSSVILIVTFGTIARADVMAKGVVSAIEALRPNCPIISCIRGTNEEEADSILRTAGLEPLYDMEEAVRKAVACAAEGGSAFAADTGAVASKADTGTSASAGTSAQGAQTSNAPAQAASASANTSTKTPAEDAQ